MYDPVSDQRVSEASFILDLSGTITNVTPDRFP